MMTPAVPPAPLSSNGIEIPADVHANLPWTEFWREGVRLHRLVQERRTAAADQEANTENAPADPAPGATQTGSDTPPAL